MEERGESRLKERRSIEEERKYMKEKRKSRE